MCGSSRPSRPPPPPPPAPAPAAPPTMVDADVQGSRGREKDRLRAAAGRQSTMLTGGGGLEQQATTGKTMLGG